MHKLKVIDAYEAADKEPFNEFSDNLRSSLQVSSLHDEVESSFEWLDLMEDTTRYIDNILRSPNRLIVNEEEIVKVELARRVTVESIKHLSKNTNFIQEIDENDEVKPSKILNINKEESFDTYENRLIYTLILRMRDFIEIKKRDTVTPYLKDTKKFEYHAKSMIGPEKININLEIDSKIDMFKKTGEANGMSALERIEKLEKDISIFLNTDVCAMLVKKRVAPVLPPVKKTNLILKNVNFQYAMVLWSYLQNNLDSTSKRKKDKKNYEETGILKEYVDETFLLDYVALSQLHDKGRELESDAIIDDITDNLISRIVELNVNLSEEKLKDMVGEKIISYRNKKIASLSEIQNTISKQVKLYLEKIENHEIERDFI